MCFHMHLFYVHLWFFKSLWLAILLGVKMYYHFYYYILLYYTSYRFIIHYVLSCLEALLKIKAGVLTDMLKDDQMLFFIWITDFALQRNSLF